MHLPIQSGSDTVLRRMARRCKTASSRPGRTARSEVPGFNVTTDLIRFPGRNRAGMAETMDSSPTGFGHIHIFPFSRARAPRPHCPTRSMHAQGAQPEMHALAAELKRRELSTPRRASRSLGAPTAGGRWIGYTPHYHKIVSSDPGIRAASISRVDIDAMSADGDKLLSHARQAQVALADIRQDGA